MIYTNLRKWVNSTNNWIYTYDVTCVKKVLQISNSPYGSFSFLLPFPGSNYTRFVHLYPQCRKTLPSGLVFAWESCSSRISRTKVVLSIVLLHVFFLRHQFVVNLVDYLNLYVNFHFSFFLLINKIVLSKFLTRSP